MDRKNFLLPKLFRGIISLIFLKTVLWIMLFLIHSCSKETNSLTIEQQKAIGNFEVTFESVIKEIKIYASFIKTDALIKKADSSYDEEFIEKVFSPLYFSSIDLLKSFGLFDEYNLEIGTADNPNIIIAGFLILASTKNLSIAAIRSDNFILPDLYGAIKPPWLDCLVEASGFAGLGELFNKGISAYIRVYGVKGTAKLLGKAAGRTVGWVGVLFALADFLECMDEGY